MKYFNLLFSLLVCTFVFGQTTVTNTVFPSVGNVIMYNQYDDNIPESSLDVQGGPFTWNFNSIDSFSYSTITEFKHPSTDPFSAAFPNANLLVEDEENGIVYLNKTAQNIKAEGRISDNPIDDGTQIAIKDINKQVYAKAPMTLGTDMSTSGLYYVAFGTEIIPDSILETLPIKIDSLRINGSIKTNGKIEAWGNLLINNKSHDVLLEKSEVITSIQFEIKAPFIGWINPTSFGFELPEPFSDFVSADTVNTYRFHKDGHVGIVGEVSYAMFQGFSFSFSKFEASILPVSTYDIARVPEWEVFPNPVITTSIVTLSSLPENHDIHITVLDLAGRVVRVQRFENATSEESVILPETNGVYTIKMVDHTSKQISSKRILKL